jgi:hypothetical protein
MSCDALWVPRRKKGEMKCIIRRIWKNYVKTYFTYSTFNKDNITKNMKDRKGRRYTHSWQPMTYI